MSPTSDAPALICSSPSGSDSDHLRNHGFLFEKGGWRLSPMFDVNPNPNKSELRQTALDGHIDSAGSMKALEQLERGYGV